MWGHFLLLNDHGPWKEESYQYQYQLVNSETVYSFGFLLLYKYKIHGHCHLIHGESVVFVTYWTSHGSGESNM